MLIKQSFPLFANEGMKNFNERVRKIMLLDITGLLLSLAIILASCELFTNGIEWFGKKLRFGDGVVGSIFSAVGTCLPETMIPVIAILFSQNRKESIDIGIGAIVGAPFMLSTLAFFVTGAGVLVFWKKRNTGMHMITNNKIIRRDIGYFILVYTLGISTAFIDSAVIKYMVAVLLLISYIYYIVITVKQDKTSHGELDALYFVKYLNTKPGMAVITAQIVLALSGIVFGAHVFVQNIEEVSTHIGISTLVLSLIITPIATELPEKFNSIIWISKRKDTLALGNITGAMVFQSCIPVAIGIFATPWELDWRAVFSAVLAILSAALTYFWINMKEKLSPVPLLAGGVFYVLFIGSILMTELG